jgi:hypothetical protein
MDAISRRLTDLDQVALLLASSLGQIAEVIPPTSATDVVSFAVVLRDPTRAASTLGSFAAGTLETNLKDFCDAMRGVRRMVRDARGSRR